MKSLIGTFPESFDLCHVSLKDGRLRLRRGFHWNETRSPVLRFRDFPNPDMPMARFFSELFRVLGFTPRVQERWTVLMPPRDIATCDAPLTQCVCQVETPNADSGLDVRHVSLKNGRLRSYRDFAYRDFASCEVLLQCL
jgi:hypothetical protein